MPHKVGNVVVAVNKNQLLLGQTPSAQRVNISELSVDQAERMGIRHAGGIAEAAINIDRSHLHVDHIAPVDDRQLVYRETDIAGGIRIIEVPGGIRSSLKSGAWRAEGHRYSIIRKMIEVRVAGVDQCLTVNALIGIQNSPVFRLRV